MVRINWKPFLAIVPITNDGNIYFGKDIFHFRDISLQFWYNNGSKHASPKWVPIRSPILRRNIALQNGIWDRDPFWGCIFGSIIVPILEISVPKINVLAKINVAVICYRDKRQNLFPINSNGRISIQKGINIINLLEMRLMHGKFPTSPGPKRHFPQK